MKLLAGFLIFVSSLAFGYQERIETNGEDTKASWISTVGPVRGYFFVSTDIFKTNDSCDAFNAKVHDLLQDWKKYPSINMYSLTNCSGSQNKYTIVFLYGVDVWDQSQIPTQQRFLRDHQGMDFLGHKFDFSQVTSLVAKTNLSLGVLNGDKLSLVYQAQHSIPYQYEDEWYPLHVSAMNFITQPSKDVFLSFVGSEFGNKEKDAFDKKLSSSNFVSLSDSFTLHLANGRTGDFWLGFGAVKNCGAQPCYANSTLLRPFSLAR